MIRVYRLLIRAAIVLAHAVVHAGREFVASRTGAEFELGGRPIEVDIETVHKVFEAVGGGMRLAIDGNRLVHPENCTRTGARGRLQTFWW